MSKTCARNVVAVDLYMKYIIIMLCLHVHRFGKRNNEYSFSDMDEGDGIYIIIIYCNVNIKGSHRIMFGRIKISRFHALIELFRDREMASN